jgi:hypothetical protein
VNEKSTRDLIDRYQGYPSYGVESAKFRAIVDLMVAQMIEHKIAPDEIRDAAFLASIKFLEMHPSDLIYRRDDLPPPIPTMSELSKKLKERGYSPITDAHCVVCQKPIHSEVDGLYCSVRCQAWDANEQHEALREDK